MLRHKPDSLFSWPIRLPVWLFVAGVTVGAASLSRASDAFQRYWPFTELRLILFAATFVVVGAGRSLLGNAPRVPLGPLVWLIGILFAHMFVLASWCWGNGGPEHEIEVYEICLLIGTLILGIWVMAADPPAFLNIVFVLHFLAACALAVASVLISGEVAGQTEALGLGGIGTARLYSVAVLAGFYFWLRFGGAYWLVPIPLFLAGTVMSGSRAALLALAFAGAVLATVGVRAIGRQISRMRPSAVVVGLVAICALVSYAFVSELGASLIESLLLSITAGDPSVSADTVYLADRDVIFREAIERFLNSPVSGGGLGSYVGPFGEMYPHNVFLAFAVDAGIVPLLIVAFCTGVALVRAAIGTSLEGTFALACAAFYIVASMFAGSYYDARWIWLFMLLCMLCESRMPAKPSLAIQAEPRI